jgi:starch-binding outer membrane protein, SusD/RagB family
MSKLKTVFYAGVVVILFWGCNDILESVEPSTSVSGDVVLTTEEGVMALRSSMYAKIRVSEASMGFMTDYFVGPSAFTDETRNRPGSTRFQAYTAATGTDGGTAHLAAYTDGYKIIQDANLLASAIEDGVLDPDTHDRFRGEALAIRAFTMHHMVRALGNEPGMIPSSGPGAGWNLGIIIRTEPTLNLEDADRRARATVDEVYEQILSDLDEAKSLLSGINDDNSYITEAFVDGLIARVNLYAGNWADAASSAQDAIANFPGSLANTADAVAGMFNENQGNHPEALFKLVVNPDTENLTGSGTPTFTNNGPAAYTSVQWVAQVPTQFVIDKYDPADYRLGWYGDCIDNQRQGATANGCGDVNANAWSILKFNGVKGNTIDDYPFFRLAEAYLILAEASAKAANSAAAGTDALNTLREARGLDPIEVANPGALLSLQAFEDEILDERIRELAVEGHRYWDLKRLGRHITNPDGSTKIRNDSHRYLAPIPEARLGENDLLEQNPGY